MNIGIVGHEAAKFTTLGEHRARAIIRELLSVPDAVLVSGHCHLGGIDIWAEEEYLSLGNPKDRMMIYPPRKLTWEGGYKQRNLLIAKHSAIVHCLVVTSLPSTYTGMRFKSCYHCNVETHVKSGGCWTAKRAPEGKWWEIENG